MITEDLSPEFLAFSAMLDEEDHLGLGESSQGALLLELRATLKDTAEVALPVDFARQTAAQAEQRFRDQSPLTRALLNLEPVLSTPVSSPRALPGLALLTALPLGGLVTSWLALGCVGAALLLAGSAWIYLSQRLLAPGPDPLRWARPALQSRKLAGLYYVVPALATLATGVACGQLVAGLGRVSLSFQGNLSGLHWLAVAAGASISVLLLSGLAPSWKALQEKSVGRLGWLLAGQLGHGLWLMLVLYFLATLNDWHGPLEAIWGGSLLASLGAALLLSCLPPVATKPGRLRAGLGHGLRSLLCGGIPILTAVAVFYRLNLTQQIQDPQQYEMAVAYSQAWMKEQRALPADQNGWTELKPLLLRNEQADPETVAVKERLQGGAQIHEYWTTPESRTSIQLQPYEQGFLRELPRIERALQKPHFSYLATEELSFTGQLPDFRICRRVSQGLAGLALQALDQHDPEKSLHYSLLNLEWSGKVRQGVLINTMIGVAQMSIALDPIQRWLSEGPHSQEPMQRLLDALQKADIPREEFAQTMQREIFACDRSLQQLLLSNKPVDFKNILGEWSLLASLAPKSYWESERKTYLNLQLGQLSGWQDLGRPRELRVELLPMSLTARELAPNAHKAQAHFMAILSRISALKIMTALELYRCRQGIYPDRLNQLVPGILQEIPGDAMHPNLWSKKHPFDYRRSGSNYQLISESPIYSTIRLQERQVYGPGGSHGLEKLP